MNSAITLATSFKKTPFPMIDDAMAPSIRLQVLSNIYLDLVSYTLLHYDYTLTLSAEMERFWSSRSLSWVSTFFYLNRYLSLFGHVPGILRDFWSPDSKVPVISIHVLTGS
ncbi:hypothetical protein H2248_001730 [Termitomyces sp. 'cryptogamus']|nr:hypothetical protein H2248_001730 [Termitomyces sp. 'cryptogamus']